VLESLIAVRIHLDACTAADGPLQVVPRSHVCGAIAPGAAAELRAAQGAVTCTVDLGDALVLRPLLLHASSKATGSSMRRVLHFLFGPPELPYGLRWQHAV
jgi:ectoine hydroxylase-related dioxygenase (phytanoyl-CoA dioxygenase family)